MSNLGTLEEAETTALKSAGFCPDGVHRDGASDSESTIPEEDHEKDPTEGLPPVSMSEKWDSTGPPEKGSGWLSTGPPIKVNHNYKTRCFEDGAGLCSPGRWRPGYRNLPDTDGLGEGLVKAAGINLDKWDKAIVVLLAGKATVSPFSDEERLGAKDFLLEWCHK